MKKVLLSLSLLICSAISSAPRQDSAQAADETQEFQMIDQNEFMAQLFKEIVLFCGEYENPESILITIPLEYIMANGDLPQKLEDEVAALSQSLIDPEQAFGIQNDVAMNLILKLIPYMTLVDDSIVSSIKALQKLGVRIIALSPFLPQHADAVIARLKTLGIDLRTTALYAKELRIDDEDGNQAALAKNGILFLEDYFQVMAVLETLVNNAHAHIEQLIVAAPYQGAVTE